MTEPGGGMTVREALEKAIREEYDIEIEALVAIDYLKPIAPIIERALRAAYKRAADDYNATAPEGCLAVCTSTNNGVIAGVAAMVDD